MDRQGERGRAATRQVLAAAAVMTAVAGCASVARVDAVSPGSTTPSSSTSPATPTAEAASYPLCAEFPVQYGPQDPHVGIESWWNGSPSDWSGEILRDPADWPEEPRTHPRVALVDTDDGAVLETWDRVACGADPSYVYVPAAPQPADSVVVVDMDTGEVIEVLYRPEIDAG